MVCGSHECIHKKCINEKEKRKTLVTCLLLKKTFVRIKLYFQYLIKFLIKSIYFIYFRENIYMIFYVTYEN